MFSVKDIWEVYVTPTIISKSGAISKIPESRQDLLKALKENPENYRIKTRVKTRENKVEQESNFERHFGTPLLSQETLINLGLEKGKHDTFNLAAFSREKLKKFLENEAKDLKVAVEDVSLTLSNFELPTCHTESLKAFLENEAKALNIAIESPSLTSSKNRSNDNNNDSSEDENDDANSSFGNALLLAFFLQENKDAKEEAKILTPFGENKILTYLEHSKNNKDEKEDEQDNPLSVLMKEVMEVIQDEKNPQNSNNPSMLTAFGIEKMKAKLSEGSNNESESDNENKEEDVGSSNKIGNDKK